MVTDVVAGSQEGGAVAFSQDDAVRRGVLHQGKMASAMQDRDPAQGPSTGTLAAVSSALSLEPQI